MQPCRVCLHVISLVGQREGGRQGNQDSSVCGLGGASQFLFDGDRERDSTSREVARDVGEQQEQEKQEQQQQEGKSPCHGASLVVEAPSRSAPPSVDCEPFLTPSEPFLTGAAAGKTPLAPAARSSCVGLPEPGGVSAMRSQVLSPNRRDIGY